MAEMSEIIIPDLGLYSHYPKEAIPRMMDKAGMMHIGLSYCRNISLARKEGCIKKSRGVSKFSASATGATDSVRGIGILNKYARPSNYQGPDSSEKYVAADTDDKHDDGTTLTDSATIVRIGNVAGVSYDGIFRFDGWTIAKDTQITSAAIYLWTKAITGTGLWQIKIYGDDSQDPSAPADHAAYAAITKTTAYASKHKLLLQVAANSLVAFSVTDIIQEIVNSFAHTNQAFQLLLTDNSSPSNHYIDFYPYNAGSAQYYAMLEIITGVGQETSPKYFMFVKGASAGELWKLGDDNVPAEVTQSGEEYGSLYQSQIAKFLQYGNDLLITDDGFNDAIQQWDVSDNPSEVEDVVANYNARYLAEFKARVWLVYPLISGVLYPQRAYYSAVNDQTSFSSYVVLPGYDAPTAAIRLTQDELIIFKEGSTVRIVDRQTTASDFQPYIISSRDGSLGANVISDGARIYGINEKGVFQWPVAAYPNGFRYISKPIKDEIDKIDLTKMNLVWFAYNPVFNQVLMHYPDTGYSRNILCAVFNIDKDCWENISDIWESNVMVDGFDAGGSPVMLFGQEDGHLKYIDGDDDEDSNFTGRFDTGALWFKDKDNKFCSRTLASIEPVSNYEGSYTLNFYWKGYDRPGSESGASWNGPYTHSTSKGNEEIVLTKLLDQAYRFHIIRMDGTLKDEAFEILAWKLNWIMGSVT